MKIGPALVLWILSLPGAAAQKQPELLATAAETGIGAPIGTSAIEQTAAVQAVADPCLSDEIVAQPSRPNWSGGATTTQCNVLEIDSGWLLTPMGHGVRQTFLPASVRYGLTPRMDLRWGMPGPIEQSGGGTSTQRGVSDQTFSVTYRFLDQRQRMPALALSYGIKDPHANPAKGFGTGRFDHQLAFIANRDLRRAHFDFNAVGTMAGAPHGRDGAAQFGMVLSFALTKSLSWLLESEGGPQPGTSDRYGAALTGASWAIHPWLVVDAAYTRAYTAGTPRSQITVGITCASRLRGTPLSRSARLARWLGR